MAVPCAFPSQGTMRGQLKYMVIFAVLSSRDCGLQQFMVLDERGLTFFSAVELLFFPVMLRN